VLITALTLLAETAGGQTISNALATDPATNPPSVLAPASERAWSFSLSASGYLVPGARDYVQPTFSADRDWLHLEARYNDEALDTGSVWVGYNFSCGDRLSLEFTPMLGGVMGDLTGIAPGYEFTLGYGKLQLYSEGEYVCATHDSSGSFFYTWSELSLAPVDWFRFGLVVQRTKAFQTDLDIQRGFLVGFTYKKVDFTTYVFNPDQGKPTVVLAVALSF
jgi:hypothetical protein